MKKTGHHQEGVLAARAQKMGKALTGRPCEKKKNPEEKSQSPRRNRNVRRWEKIFPQERANSQDVPTGQEFVGKGKGGGRL